MQWQVAHEIARKLVREGADVNELRKTISYLRKYVNRDNAGKAFFDFLKTLVCRGNQIGHSKQTITYYKSLNHACEEYLKDYQDQAHKMLLILGWAARLVKYYKGIPTAEIQPIEVISEREAEIQAVVASQDFFEGQELEAIVTAIKGKQVTYEILGTIRRTSKEPKQADQLSEGQTVTVKVTALGADGSPKNVKFTG